MRSPAKPNDGEATLSECSSLLHTQSTQNDPLRQMRNETNSKIESRLLQAQEVLMATNLQELSSIRLQDGSSGQTGKTESSALQQI